MSEYMHGGGIGKIVGGYEYRLDGGNGPGLGTADPLLQLGELCG